MTTSSNTEPRRLELTHPLLFKFTHTYVTSQQCELMIDITMHFSLHGPIISSFISLGHSSEIVVDNNYCLIVHHPRL